MWWKREGAKDEDDVWIASNGNRGDDGVLHDTGNTEKGKSGDVALSRKRYIGPDTFVHSINILKHLAQRSDLYLFHSTFFKICDCSFNTLDIKNISFTFEFLCYEV